MEQTHQEFNYSQRIEWREISKNNSTIAYNSLVYGSKIKAKKKWYHSVKGTVNCNTLVLTNIRGGYVFIVARRSELEQHNDSIIIQDGSGQEVDSDSCQTKYCP